MYFLFISFHLPPIPALYGFGVIVASGYYCCVMQGRDAGGQRKGQYLISHDTQKKIFQLQKEETFGYQKQMKWAFLLSGTRSEMKNLLAFMRPPS